MTYRHPCCAGNQRFLQPDPFLLRALERLVLLRVLTTIGTLIFSTRVDFQVVSDSLNAVAWLLFLFRICFTLMNSSLWWLMGWSGSDLIERVLLNWTTLRLRFYDIITKYSSFTRSSCQAKKMRCSPLPFNASCFSDYRRLDLPLDDTEEDGIEMRTILMPTAPYRMTVDRGERRHSARNKDL